MQEILEILKVIIYTGIAGIVIAAALYVLWVAISSLLAQNKLFFEYLMHKESYLKYKKLKRLEDISVIDAEEVIPTNYDDFVENKNSTQNEKK